MTTFNTNLVGGNESASGSEDVKSGVATINNGTNPSINTWGDDILTQLWFFFKSCKGIQMKKLWSL